MSDRSLRDLVGRMLLIGFAEQALDSDLRALLLDIRPGGVVLFKRNVTGGPRQVAQLIAGLQDLARTEFGRPLLIAIDQEGGSVRRLAPPFSVLPSQKVMGQTMDASRVRALGATSGRELAAVGINLNLTPVLDINTEPLAEYMADRCFGSNPGLTAELGLALIDGHADHGVLTCAKHFPGIGDTQLDPHDQLPTVTHSVDRLKKMEILPFSRAVEQGITGVMTAHVRFSELDPQWPGTFSPDILTRLLRGELGFRGLILTDDLEMGAVVNNYDFGAAAVQTVTAGSDLLLICHRADRIHTARQALMDAWNSRRLTTIRLEESAARLDAVLRRLTMPPTEAWKTLIQDRRPDPLSA